MVVTYSNIKQQKKNMTSSDWKCDINATFLAKPSTVVVHGIGKIATQLKSHRCLSADHLVLDERRGGICYFFTNVLHAYCMRIAQRDCV